MIKRDGSNNPLDHLLITGIQKGKAVANASPRYLYAGRQGCISRWHRASRMHAIGHNSGGFNKVTDHRWL